MGSEPVEPRLCPPQFFFSLPPTTANGDHQPTPSLNEIAISSLLTFNIGSKPHTKVLWKMNHSKTYLIRLVPWPIRFIRASMQWEHSIIGALHSRSVNQKSSPPLKIPSALAFLRPSSAPVELFLMSVYTRQLWKTSRARRLFARVPIAIRNLDWLRPVIGHVPSMQKKSL